MNLTNEKAFEESIEQSLLKYGGYVKGNPKSIISQIADHHDYVNGIAKAIEVNSEVFLTEIIIEYLNNIGQDKYRELVRTIKS